MSNDGGAKGMELFNLFDQSIQKIVPELPQEVGTIALIRGTMVSVNDETELIIAGGQNNIVHNEIWKFNFRWKSWKMIGTLRNPKVELFAVKVNNLNFTCH